ncbi:MFS transporter [Yinghuangia seranimata]|uniref:MFS transporter n=1 Tax=Yinghuangia seranimata TaxID=408067 RepID=UPI00248B9160|nr:MFS transporter [Yinghuangia seranimata]MDI2125716.1 MFS transporter [Yinghuangia seranimata]
MSSSAAAPAAGRSAAPRADARPPGADAPRVRQRPGLALAVITGSMLLIGIDVTVVNLALPDMSAALDLSPTASSWVLNAYTLVFGGLLLLGGRLGDVFGRRRMFVAGVAVFTLASLLAGLAPWAWALLAARALQGVGGAFVGPSTMALIVSTFDGPARARAISWYSAVLGAGASVGLVLGGVLTDLASWRWVFLVNVPLGALLIALTPRVVAEPPRPERSGARPGFDAAGALTGTLGIGSLVYACIRAASDGWHDTRTAAALVVAVVLLASFVVAERRAEAPITPPRLVTRGTLARVLPVMVLYCAAMFSVLFMLGRYFQDGRDFSPIRAGMAFLPLMACQFTMARLAPAVLRKVGPAWPALVGSVLAAGGLLWLSQLGPHDAYATHILGPLILIGTGAGTAMTPLNAYGMSGVDPAESGAASGLVQTAQWIGGTLGLAAWVTVFGTTTRDAAPGADPTTVLTDGVTAAFAGAGLSAVAAAVAALALFRRQASPGAAKG